MAGRDDIPGGRLRRLARLGTLGARVAAGKAKSLIGGDDPTGLAEAAGRTLGEMRGLALKLGQLASYVDGMVPAEHRGTYEKALASLRNAAPTMSAAAARRVVKEELGRSPEELFAEWEEEPFASASLGQVHRARLRSGEKVTVGEEVAVKVQYEGVERAVLSDLANANLLRRLTGPIGARAHLDDAVAEMRARFLEELDYRHEARAQETFAAYFDGVPEVRVPRVYPDLSAKRVLTTELVRGLSFDEACAAPDEQRRAWAETLWRFQFESLVMRGHFNADPHPGNYVFAGEGRVWFLDFGCTRRLSDERAAAMRAMHNSAWGERTIFYGNFERMLDLPEGGKLNAILRDYIDVCFEPIRAAGAYVITHELCERLMSELTRDAKHALMRAPKADIPELPAELLFVNRLQFGFYSVLARMQVAANYSAVHRALLARGQAPALAADA